MAANSIKTLPPALLEQLQGWLRDPAITQLEATDSMPSSPSWAKNRAARARSTAMR